jgi:hypothetical protein
VCASRCLLPGGGCRSYIFIFIFTVDVDVDGGPATLARCLRFAPREQSLTNL